LHLVTGSVEQIVHGAAVLAAKLLRNLGELPHALLPVVKLFDWTVILTMSSFSSSIIEVRGDLALPLLEDGGVVENERNLKSTAIADASFLLVTELSKRNVGLKGLLGLHELLSKLVEGLDEFLLLVGLAHCPIFICHSVQHGLIDVVDEGLEHAHRVFRDLSEEYLIIIGLLLVNFLALLGVPHEEDSFAHELDIVTYY